MKNLYYKVLKAKSLSDLETSVHEAITEGFTPTGGISRITERVRKKTQESPTGEWETITWFIQAVYKRG